MKTALILAGGYVAVGALVGFVISPALKGGRSVSALWLWPLNVYNLLKFTPWKQGGPGVPIPGAPGHYFMGA